MVKALCLLTLALALVAWGAFPAHRLAGTVARPSLEPFAPAQDTATMNGPSVNPYHVDLTTCPVESLPVIHPDVVLATDPAEAGPWVVAGDLDGDGVAEIVQARLWEEGDTHAVASVCVHRLDGSLLWRWGDPADSVDCLHSDVPCQVHDWNRDGRPEVVVVTRTHVVVLEGATGRELFRFPTPCLEAGDCLVFANLSGGEADDLIIKTRYHQIWAYTWRGELLWETTDPAGCPTAHQPYPLDLDGDGRDELVAGYAVLDQDGSVLWALDAAALGLGRGHLDCARVLARGECPEDWRLLLTCCGDHALLCVDGTGRLHWDQRGQHFESLNVGRLLPDRPGVQIVVDIDHAAPGQSPLRVYAPDGTLRGEFNSRYARHHPLVTWGDDPVERIVACGDLLLLDAAGGRPLARFEAPLPPGAGFGTVGRVQEHTAVGEYTVQGYTGNLFGTGGPDLLLATNPGGVIWVYRNPASGAPDTPVGTGRNVTLY